ncbi:remodeling and spacing factor 1 isoform X4 [Alosa sapidissima]|uniref:remodeling and spacing factor 1 isoform X4 n=1 Tax=Alosa sapidissima TaxID=34773 RepID=UPI001C0A1B1C|nr:remodeling and spacing factor 1 isoform X4 [Alosa sapidissima]
MAASAAAAAPSPGLCPSFAVICSFLERYGALLDLPELTFPQLERYLQDNSSVPKLLVDLHVKLLRKIGKSVSADRWEKYLVKVCQEFNTTWAWELEKKGYKEMTVECKTGILKYLCECQFDDNVKFKTAVNEEDPEKMRLQPIGKDKDGLMYWFQLDQDHNVRVYVEEQDDLDGSSWKCIVRNRNDLAEMLALLKTHIDPALLVKKEGEEEATGTSANPEDQEKKGEDNGDVKKEEDVGNDADKPSEENKSPASSKSESQKDSTGNENMKQEVPAEDAALKDSHKGADVASEKPVGEPEEHTVKTTIKEEPMEVSKPTKAGSEVTASKLTGPPVTEPTEEARRKTAEEVQRAIKNDQQAKIPLKKREMKLSEDFDSNAGSGGSSVIVANTSLVTAKEPVKELNGDQVNGDMQPVKANESGTKFGIASTAAATTTTEVERRKEAQEEKMEASQTSGKKEESNKQQLEKAEKTEILAEKEKVSTLPSEEKMDVDKPEASSCIKSTGTPDDKQEKLHKLPQEVTSSIRKDNEPPFTTIRKAPSSEEKSTSSISDAKSSEMLDNHGVTPKGTTIPNSSKDKPDCSKESSTTSAQNDSKKLDGQKGTEKQPPDQTDKPAPPKSTEQVTLSPPNEEEKSRDPKEEDSSKTKKSSVSKTVGEPQVSVEKDTKKVGDNNKQTSPEDVGKSLTEDLSVSKKTSGLSVIRETKSPILIKKSEDATTKESEKTSTKEHDKPSTKESDKPSTKESNKPSVIKEQFTSETTTRVASVIKMDTSRSSDEKDKQTVISETDKKSPGQESTKSTPSVDKEKSPTSKEVVKSFPAKEFEHQPSTEKTEALKLKEKGSIEMEVSCRESGTKGTSKEIEKEKGHTPLASVANPKDADKLDSGKDKTSTSAPEVTPKETGKAEKEAKKLPEKSGPSAQSMEEPMEVQTSVSGPVKTSSVSEVGKAGEKKDAEKMDTIEKVKDKNNETKRVEKKDDAEKVEEKKDVFKKTEQLKDPSKQTEQLKDPPKQTEQKKDESKQDESKKAEVKNDESTKTEEKKDASKKAEEKKDASKKAVEKKDESKKDESRKAVEKKDESKHMEEKDCHAETTPMDCDEPAKKDAEKKKSTSESEHDPKQDGEKHEPSKAKKDHSGSEKSKEKDEEKTDEPDKSAAQTGDGECGENEGLHLKIRMAAHRRKAEVQREERRADSESEAVDGRGLRRSPRICRPTAKVAEIQDRKQEKKQITPLANKEAEKPENEEQEEEEEEECPVPVKKPKEKKVDTDGHPKSKGKRRRRTRWSNTRTRRKKKGSEDDDDDDDDEDGSSVEEESEEDDSDEDYKVEKRPRRTRNRRERNTDDSDTSSDDDLPPNDDPCKHCGLPNHPELILLCDSCDSGYHTACLRPPLMIIPDGEWFCPPCQHKLLCEKLEEQLTNLDAVLKKRERAERRKERLVYVGISVENIITPSVEVEEQKEPEVEKKEKKEVKKSKSWGRRSTRAKKFISYRFDEFDEAIEEAIEEDLKEAEGGGAGRGKDMANITGLRGKDMSTILSEDGKENGKPQRPNVGQRRKKRRRLNDLDSDSTVDEEESEDEFRISDSSEEEEFVVSENDADSDAEVKSGDDSDFGSTGNGPRFRGSAWSRKPVKRRWNTRQPRRRRRPKGYSDDEELEETEEEEDDEIVTEGSSEFSESDLDMRRRRSRRSLKKAVNYCETSESDGSQTAKNRDKMKPRKSLSSSESQASFSSRDSDEGERKKKRRRDSSEEDSKKRRRHLSLKRRKESEDSDDDSDDSEEEDRPIRKRVNRIDSDDSDEEEEEEKKSAPAEKESEESKRPPRLGLDEEDEEAAALVKGTSPLDYLVVDLPPTNGQSPMKGPEGLISRPPGGAVVGAAAGLLAHIGPKNPAAATAVAMTTNGLVPQEMPPPDEDEDDLLGVTDLVDYVCNSEQL